MAIFTIRIKVIEKGIFPKELPLMTCPTIGNVRFAAPAKKAFGLWVKRDLYIQRRGEGNLLYSFRVAVEGWGGAALAQARLRRAKLPYSSMTIDYSVSILVQSYSARAGSNRDS